MGNAPPNMALQRTRRPRCCSGRSLRSLGSPLSFRSLAALRRLARASILLLLVSVGGPSCLAQPYPELSASHTGYDLVGGWEMTIDKAGRMWFRMLNWNGPDQSFPPRSIDPKKLDKAYAALKNQGFCQLGDYYGVIPVHGPERRISARCGNSIKTVTIFTVRPDGELTLSERVETKRVLEIWLVLRALVDHPAAIDSRAADRAFARLGG